MNFLFYISELTGLSITMISALIASVLIAMTSGILGTFIVLRRLSLMGDALSHAILPGVAISFIFNINMMIGATFFGLLASTSIEFIIKKSKIKTDASIGIVLSSFFALGIILISKAHSGMDLNHILFGNILAVKPSELLQSAIIFAIILTVTILLYKELLITSFDPVMAKAYGLNNGVYHYLLMLCLTLFTVSALSQVGIVLVIAMLVTPSASAYLLTNKLSRMMWVASMIGVVSGISGVIISFKFNFPTNATIVLTSAFIFIIAFVISPKNGFYKKIKRRYIL